MGHSMKGKIIDKKESVQFLVWQPRAEEMDLMTEGQHMPPAQVAQATLCGVVEEATSSLGDAGSVCGDVRLCVPFVAFYGVRHDPEDIKPEK